MNTSGPIFHEVIDGSPRFPIGTAIPGMFARCTFGILAPNVLFIASMKRLATMPCPLLDGWTPSRLNMPPLMKSIVNASPDNSQGAIFDTTGTVRYYNTLFGNGLREDGTVAISDMKPSAVRTSGKRPTVVVQLCQDTTRLQVLDKKGNDVLEADSKKVSPMVVTVQRWDDGWFVTNLEAGEHAC